MLREVWCAEKDLNLHTLRHRLLRPACLPIPPPARAGRINEAEELRQRDFRALAGESRSLRVYCNSGGPLLSPEWPSSFALWGDRSHLCT